MRKFQRVISAAISGSLAVSSALILMAALTHTNASTAPTFVAQNNSGNQGGNRGGTRGGENNARDTGSKGGSSNDGKGGGGTKGGSGETKSADRDTGTRKT